MSLMKNLPFDYIIKTHEKFINKVTYSKSQDYLQ